MRDLNFFEPYIEKRQFSFDRLLLMYIILGISLVTMAGLGIYNQFSIRSLRKQVRDRTAVVTNPTTVKKYEEIKALEEEINIFRQEVEKVVELDNNIEENDKIDAGLISLIRSKMPTDLFLTSLSLKDFDISISGVSKSTYSVAEFAKGLELLEDSEGIFISNITNEGDHYNFSLNLSLKDVNMDGNQASEE